MNILLLCSGFNGLSQRFFVELADAGHKVVVHIFTSDDALMLQIKNCPPDIIIAPFLTRAIPQHIWQRFLCFILHPGIVGDRGPCSLDWAILEGWSEWGVTLLQANAVMDAGDIWATRKFPLPPMGKSRIYRQQVTEAAVGCLWELLEKLKRGQQRGEPLDYDSINVRGRERAPLSVAERTIDWQSDVTSTLLRKIWASDSKPGASAFLADIPVKLFNVWKADVTLAQIRGRNGEIFARSGNAVCVATVDGALWIGHLRRCDTHPLAKVKLPAAHVLGPVLPTLAQLPNQRVAHPDHPWLERCGRIGVLHFPFLNGAFSTDDSVTLRNLFEAAARDTHLDAIILAGGNDFWSNGIDLNSIHAANDSAAEGWESINAIDDLAESIFRCRDKLIISAVNANAGAGGAMLMLTADMVIARAGVVINPHYKTMGLTGSELWTLTLPWRVGPAMASELTERCMPISASKAASLGMIDTALETSRFSFLGEVIAMVAEMIAPSTLTGYLQKKWRDKNSMLKSKSVTEYRRRELEGMRSNLFDDDLNFSALRKAFVLKQQPVCTPSHLAKFNTSQ
ncbi:enoyl-CoA hydratase-related protein [Vagococcus sp. WN89Y]|uniref:enoyl-CoA hydratase-related protein n=1 Tax=Vagococcus sp. WN89Y TaxID=3457258 RepID=UPI003FCC66EE